MSVTLIIFNALIFDDFILSSCVVYRLRDGMSLREAITSSYADFRDLGWKNFIRRAQGLETKVKAKQDLSSV